MSGLQLSVEPPSISVAARVAFPEPSKNKVIFWQTAAGAVLSITVTVLEQELVLPEPSVAVRVTAFAPTSLQVKAVTEALREGVPQLSVLPLSISLVVMVAFPVPSKCTEMLWQATVGAVLSITVTVLEQELVLPEPSVAVSTTALFPISLQVKDVADAPNVGDPQLSVLPLSMSLAVMVAFPEPSKYTEMLWHNALGAVESVMVTTEVQLAVLLEASVTVRVTETVPISLQVKLVVDAP